MHSDCRAYGLLSDQPNVKHQRSGINGMESTPYCGYPPNYWYAAPPPAGPYGNTYPSGADMNGQAAYNPQAMAYPNGVYGPGQYPPGVLHPSNPFYCSEQLPPRQPQYHNHERPAASSPQPPYPVTHCQAAPGYPPSSYPAYGDGCPTNGPFPPQQALPSCPQPEPWAHTGPYGPQGHYANHTRPPHPPPWQGPAPPPYEHIKHKEPPYPGQAHLNPRIQASCPKPAAGTPNSHPSLGQSKPAEFSAPPHIYARTSSGGGPAQNDPPVSAVGAASLPFQSDVPGLAQVQQVLARVHLLQEDVDEFVGRKTDKSYRYLEELLTKELLVLDSVETNGQDAVRTARREAVQKIQAILDRLEYKAF